MVKKNPYFALTEGALIAKAIKARDLDGLDALIVRAREVAKEERQSMVPGGDVRAQKQIALLYAAADFLRHELALEQSAREAARKAVGLP